MQNEFTSMFVPFIIVIFVIIFAYLGTRFISAKYTRMTSGKHLKIIERVSLGQDKSLLLVTIKAKTYLIGVSGSGINIVSEFIEGEFADDTNIGNTDFYSVLTDNFKKMLFHNPSASAVNKSDLPNLLSMNFKKVFDRLPRGKSSNKSDKDEL